MTRQVNMHEAKTHFSKLAEAVEAGEEIVIARAGKPVMRLVKIEDVQQQIVPGFAEDIFANWDDSTWRSLDREFNDLFIGIGRGELLPFASYYLTGFLNEKPLATLRKDMADLSIARAPNVYEPEDNIASLMEMMAGLIDGRFGAPASLEKQREFFNRHIAPWAGHFYSDLEKARGSVFFLPVGTLGRIFIDIEREAFRLGGT